MRDAHLANLAYGALANLQRLDASRFLRRLGFGVSANISNGMFRVFFPGKSGEGMRRERAYHLVRSIACAVAAPPDDGETAGSARRRPELGRAGAARLELT